MVVVGGAEFVDDGWVLSYMQRRMIEAALNPDKFQIIEYFTLYDLLYIYFTDQPIYLKMAAGDLKRAGCPLTFIEHLTSPYLFAFDVNTFATKLFALMSNHAHDCPRAPIFEYKIKPFIIYNSERSIHQQLVTEYKYLPFLQYCEKYIAELVSRLYKSNIITI